MTQLHDRHHNQYYRFSSSSISQPHISSLASDTPNLVNIVAAATLSSKKLHRYSTLDIILEKKCLIWPNRYKFYNLGIATRALNSAHMPKIGCTHQKHELHRAK